MVQEERLSTQLLGSTARSTMASTNNLKGISAMGRLAQRLARRHHPLYESAKELVRLAADESRELYEADEDLEEVLDAHLAELDSDDFDELLSLAVEESELLTDGEDVKGYILSVVHETAQSFVSDTGYARCHLFALPLVVGNYKSVGEAVLTTEQCEAVIEALRGSELVAVDSFIGLLPRLLPAAVAEQLRFGDVHAVTRALGDDDADRALGCVEEHWKLSGTQGRLGNEDVESIGVLLGVVDCDEEAPFVVAKLAEVEHKHLPCAADPNYAQAHQELHADLQEHLDDFAQALSLVLDGASVSVPVPVDAFYDNQSVGFMMERETTARRELKTLADEHCGGDLTALTLHQPGVDQGLLAYPVHRKVDGTLLGLLHWPDARDESLASAMVRMFHLMHALGIRPEFKLESVDSEPSGPLH
jgi:hypothetical protein